VKILFLTHSFGEQGTYWRCLFLGRYLAKKGHKVTVVARGPGKETMISKKWGVETLFFPSWKTQWLRRIPLVLGTDFDLIHVFAAANFCNSLPGLFAMFKGTKVLVDWDDWWTRGGLVQGTPLLPVRTIMEEKLPILASAVTVVSDALKQRALSCGVKEERIFKIENGSNVEDIRVCQKSESRKKIEVENVPILLYIGYWGTDIQFLIHVIRKVRSVIRDARLIVVGHKGISNDVVSFVGHLSYELIQNYLSASDIQCMPMDNDLVGKARWPIKLGDYMASGRPIVGSDVGEVGRILREVDFSLVSEPANPSDMAAKIIRLLRDESWSVELGKKIRRLAETRYSWSLTTNSLEEVYRKVMN
jgi:glycosyltransferase involved in cell wall biosynthesis